MTSDNDILPAAAGSRGCGARFRQLVRPLEPGLRDRVREFLQTRHRSPQRPPYALADGELPSPTARRPSGSANCGPISWRLRRRREGEQNARESEDHHRDAPEKSVWALARPLSLLGPTSSPMSTGDRDRDRARASWFAPPNVRLPRSQGRHAKPPPITPAEPAEPKL
jgi:hypothetical protein